MALLWQKSAQRKAELPFPAFSGVVVANKEREAKSPTKSPTRNQTQRRQKQKLCIGLYLHIDDADTIR
jgi:hypothetical protein